ncbi:MAG: TnsA endonuclease N-terminal domain-containing protein [Chloroflexota bacterium]|nr:TnsA endonuclease N-terminal domain-containing protein [Chloroflexota bacterium]MDQ5864451.1 TnsA endonuclease N-terminal domain-containing protein [Chloroflexota bacterium]
MALKRKPPKNNVRRVHSTGTNIRGVTLGTDSTTQQFESFEERKLALLLQRDKTILKFVSQPMLLNYVDQECKQRTYTPDYLVERLDGSIEIHEVTITLRQHREDIIRRTDAARRICRARGWKYVQHTEQTLPCGTTLANLQALYLYAPRCYSDRVVADATFELLSTAGGRPVSLRLLAIRLMQTLKLPADRIVPVLAHLIWHSKIETDLRRLLFINATPSPQALIWLPQLPTETTG